MERELIEGEEIFSESHEEAARKTSLSVIIPVFNSEDTLEECLHSVLASDIDVKFEVIVVDDASADRTSDIIRAFNVRHLRHESNRGAAAARNSGVRISEGEFLVFVDADTVLEKDTIRRIHAHLASGDVDYVSVLYSLDPLNKGWIPKYRALANYCYYYEFIFSGHEGPIRGETLGGGVESFRKNVFLELGGFDESIRGAGIENEILLSRMYGKYNMLSDPAILVRHHFPSFIELAGEYFSRTYAVMRLLTKKRYDQPYINKNALRVGLGGILPPSGLLILVALPLCPLMALLTAIISAPVFAAYLYMHRKLFILALEKHGLLFMLFSLPVNIFYCSVISSAGFAGTVSSFLKGGLKSG